MIEEVNKLSAPQTSARLASSNGGAGVGESSVPTIQEDPINQLTAILGAHLRALGNIDGSAGRLEEQVRALEGRMSEDANRARR